jgi:hypothetical protein
MFSQLKSKARSLGVYALVAALAFAAGYASLAHAIDPVTFYACRNVGKNTLYNVVTSPSLPLACIKGDIAVQWNQAGPMGPQGPAGLTGPAGPAGPQGDPGPAGADGAQGPAGPQGDPGADGAQGPQGDPSISGYEVVRGPTVTGGGGTYTATATCPAGKKVLGGGGSQGDFGYYLDDSRPNDDGSGWQVQYSPDSGDLHGGGIGEAWAICAFVQ